MGDTLDYLKAKYIGDDPVKRAAYRRELAVAMLERCDPALAAVLVEVETAIRDYYFALDSREHGGVAQDRAFRAIQEAMGMRWVQGEEAGRRGV